jgi:hypothetical protein
VEAADVTRGSSARGSEKALERKLSKTQRQETPRLL